MSRVIHCEPLARVEGEGAFEVRLDQGQVTSAKFRVLEPPRFFESFLRGRHALEAPDITSRICGICPVAYQTSACQAMEAVGGIELRGSLRLLRRLIYCGEWIESHMLHVVMLHAPDFLGYDDGIAMARDHRQIVEYGLRIRRLGNDLMAFLGGREIHPINIRVGGFYRAPSRFELAGFSERLKEARELMVGICKWVAGFEFPDYNFDTEFVALRAEGEYAIDRGMIVSSKGLRLAPSAYEDHFIEEQVAHSTALHSYRVHAEQREWGTYITGPIARYNLNNDLLSPFAKQLAADAGLGSRCLNPFKSIIIRAIEVAYACDEAIGLIDRYERPARAYEDFQPRTNRGCGVSEAPRGLLYHRYNVDRDGLIQDARIVPPTAQNQRRIEADLGAYVGWRLGRDAELGDEKLGRECEQLVRNYDPCISCSTHAISARIVRQS